MMGPSAIGAQPPPDNHDWKAEYLRQVDLHNQTLDELREAEMQLRNPAPTPPTPSQQARPLDEWDEWNGNVLWWKFPIDEPPYVGTPLDTDWPKYHTHWTPLGVPDMPLPAPIPPTVPDTNLETATNRNYLESIGQLPPTEGSKP